MTAEFRTLQKSPVQKDPSEISGTTAYLKAQVEEIRFLYEIFFPDEQTEVHLWWGHAPIPTPEILPAGTYMRGDALTPEYLGQIIVGAERCGAIRRQVFLTIPALPTPEELKESDMPWSARSWKVRAALKASPLLFEEAKHWIERRAERKRSRRHSFDKLIACRSIRYSETATLQDHKKQPAALIGFHWLEVGGAEKLAFQSVDWAREAGLRVFVISDRSGLQRCAERLPQEEGVHFLRTDRYLPRDHYPAFIKQLVLRENITLTHNHHCTILYECLPTLKAHFPAIKNIDSTHIVEYADGGYPRTSGVWSNFLDLHHVISEDLREFLDNRLHVGGKLQLGRLLSDEDRAKTPNPVRLKACQSQCRVVFVGRMTHQKRPILAIEIIRRLASWGRKVGVSFRFDMVGEGNYRQACEYLLRRYRLDQMVELHGADTDVPAMLGNSDIMLLPSANEGLALVCYEAIKAGCVPVSTNVGAQYEIVPASLLVDRVPRKTVRQSTRIVKRLLTDQAFTDHVTAEMGHLFNAVRHQPLAEEVLKPIYHEAASQNNPAHK